MAAAEPLIGSVDLWPIDWAPQGWAICNGQLLSINENQALYSLIGHIYDGGSSQTTFGVPNLCGRVPVGVGRSPRGLDYKLGAKGGNEGVTLTYSEMPVHTHIAKLNPPDYLASGTVKPKAKTGLGALTNTPANNFMGPSGSNNLYSTAANANMGAADVSITVAVDPDPKKQGSVVIGTAGVGNPFDNRMLYLALNYVIALAGIYPQRS